MLVELLVVLVVLILVTLVVLDMLGLLIGVLSRVLVGGLLVSGVGFLLLLVARGELRDLILRLLELSLKVMVCVNEVLVSLGQALDFFAELRSRLLSLLEFFGELLDTLVQGVNLVLIGLAAARVLVYDLDLGGLLGKGGDLACLDLSSVGTQLILEGL